MPLWLINNFSSSNSTAGKGKLYYGWIVLLSCFIIAVIGFGIQYSFGVFFKSLEVDFGLTRTLTSAIFSAFLLLCPVFGVLNGWILDHYGPRIIIILMGFFTGLSLSLTSLSNAPWHLFVNYSLLLAIGNGPTWNITMSTASRWFIERRGLALGIVGSGVGIGSILMAPITAYLIANYGWRISYLVIGLAALFIMVPCSLLLKRAPSEAAGRKPETINLNFPDRQNSIELGEFSPLQAAKTGSFWLLISIWFLYAFCLLMIVTHIVPHAIDLDISSMQAALMLSLMGGVNIPGRIAMGIASDRFGRKRTAVICALLMAGAMLWLTESSSLWMLYLFATVFGFSYGGLAPPTTAIVGDIFGLRHIGVILGALGISWGAGAAVGPALAGYIFDVTGSYYLAFLLAMVAALIMAVLALLLRAPRAKRNQLSSR